MSGRLQGRVAIVTGGGRGIGAAYVRRFAAEGAKVVVAELDGAAGEAIAAELTAQGRPAIAAQTDVTEAAQLQAMAQRAIERFGRIDVLVNNAAMFVSVPMSRLPFDQIDPDEWDRMMEVNLKGLWLACRAVIPQMRRQGYGKIVNISSGTALRGSTTRIHYVTSKAGVIGFTRVLAGEVGADNICVNCIAPGSTLSHEQAEETLLQRQRGARGGRAIPRVQTPADLTGAAVFFASADSDFITGQTLVVDGGACMH